MNLREEIYTAYRRHIEENPEKNRAGALALKELLEHSPLSWKGVVEKTLQEIGAGNKPVYVVFNKIDAYHYEEYDEFSLEPRTKLNRTLDELKNSWIAQEKTPCIFISAINRTGLEKLRHDIYKMVAEIHAGRYPFNNFLF